MTHLSHSLHAGRASTDAVAHWSAKRLSWRAAVNAVLGAVILFAVSAALGLAMAWSIVSLLRLPGVFLAIFGTAVVAACASAAVWLCRTAYAAELRNCAERRQASAAGSPAQDDFSWRLEE